MRLGILILASVLSIPAQNIAPNWTALPSVAYQAGIDHKVVHTGHASLFLKSDSGDARGYSARQRIRADLFRGKRIRLSGWVKSDKAPQGGALWLRIDMENGDYVLDSMLELSGRDWARVQLVAEVPPDAAGISFGLRMLGAGQIWCDDLTFDTVPLNTPTTTIERRKDKTATNVAVEYSKSPLKPGNLNFEQ